LSETTNQFAKDVLNLYPENVLILRQI